MVPAFGVWTFSVAAGLSVDWEGSGAGVLATSKLAAYSHLSQAAMKSSPLCTKTWNSALPLPPMAPESALTIRYVSPMRSKMRVYATRIFS